MKTSTETVRALSGVWTPPTPSEGVIDRLHGKAGDVVLCEFRIANTAAPVFASAMQAVLDWDKNRAQFLGFFDELVFGGFKFEVAVSGLASVADPALRMSMNTGHIAAISPVDADAWAKEGQVCSVLVLNPTAPGTPMTKAVLNGRTLEGDTLSFYAKFKLLEDVSGRNPVVVKGSQMMGASGEGFSLNCESKSFAGVGDVLLFTPSWL